MKWSAPKSDDAWAQTLLESEDILVHDGGEPGRPDNPWAVLFEYITSKDTGKLLDGENDEAENGVWQTNGGLQIAADFSGTIAIRSEDKPKFEEFYERAKKYVADASVAVATNHIRRVTSRA